VVDADFTDIAVGVRLRSIVSCWTAAERVAQDPRKTLSLRPSSRSATSPTPFLSSGIEQAQIWARSPVALHHRSP
jgi:hypothetical protein